MTRPEMSARTTWLALLGLCLGMSVTNGFARFAYGLILPAMRSELGWSYAQAGWLNTANALGYLAGALLTLWMVSRVSVAALYALGMVATALALLATGVSEAFWWQTAWRFVAGLFGALSFSTAGALAAQLFAHDGRRNALAIALLFGFGGGLGIILTGASLPAMLAILGPSSWPMAWTLVGAASLAFLPMGLWAGWVLRPPRRVAASPRVALPVRRMLPEFIGYGSFGMGYFVYFTFLGSWMKAQAVPPLLAGSAWVLIGLCLGVSPFLWRGVFARFRGGAPLAMILAGVAVGVWLPLVVAGTAGLILSALVFGLCVFMSPGAITSFTRHNLPPESWGVSISLFTVVFATTQTIGPYAAGWIGDLTGDIGNALLGSGLVLAAGACVAALQRPLD